MRHDRAARSSSAALRHVSGYAAASASDELNVVPFLDIIVNIVMYLLATVAFVLATTQIDVSPPGLCRGPRCTPPPSLALSVVVGTRGIHVQTAGGALASGCRATQPVSAPARAAVPSGDWAALEACARVLRRAHPDEQSVVLSADPEIPYDQVVAAMDALRSSFPDVQIAAGVR